MSGRLIILPKKTYCPWRPENVERVLKDEQRERQRQKQLEMEQEQLESKQRLAKLKKRDSDHVQEKQGHVNLFQAEEQDMVKAAVSAPSHQKPAPLKGVMPVRLDSVLPKNKEQPFYVRTSKIRHDEKRKALMDPMKDFVKKEIDPAAAIRGSSATLKSRDEHSKRCNDSPHSKRRRKQSSRRGGDSDNSDSDGLMTRRSSRRRRHEKKRRKRSSKSERCSDDSKRASIEELRRRRQEREYNESQREAALRNETGGGKGDTSRRYTDVFYPSLSRR